MSAEESITSTPPPAPTTVQPATLPLPSYRVVTGTEEWHNEIFDCLEPTDLCVKTTFCPCFTFGKTQHRLREPSMATYERINPDCGIWLGLNYLCGAAAFWSFLKRQELRKQFNLKGDDLTDAFYSCCCHCCSLIQQEKEVIFRQGPAAVVSAGKGYVAPKEQMVAENQNQNLGPGAKTE